MACSYGVEVFCFVTEFPFGLRIITLQKKQFEIYLK